LVERREARKQAKDDYKAKKRAAKQEYKAERKTAKEDYKTEKESADANLKAAGQAEGVQHGGHPASSGK
jgi:F0F1-type ATP synthase membrane subunit b/b'